MLPSASALQASEQIIYGHSHPHPVRATSSAGCMKMKFPGARTSLRETQHPSPSCPAIVVFHQIRNTCPGLPGELESSSKLEFQELLASIRALPLCHRYARQLVENRVCGRSIPWGFASIASLSVHTCGVGSARPCVDGTGTAFGCFNFFYAFSTPPSGPAMNSAGQTVLS